MNSKTVCSIACLCCFSASLGLVGRPAYLRNDPARFLVLRDDVEQHIPYVLQRQLRHPSANK